MKFYRKIIVLFTIIIILSGSTILAISLINSHIQKKSDAYIFFDINKAPKTQAVLILGAKVSQGGRMSPMLYDRVETALDLYNKGKVEKFLVSGDHGRKNYDEVNPIKEYLLKKDIPPEDIFLDHAGFDTYDSLFRAKYIFQVQSLTVVTQNFHLPRAVYLGRSLIIDTYGVSADKQFYGDIKHNKSRETIASIKAFFDIYFRVKPKYLGEPIPITEDSRKSWD
jgi:SanA protein